MPATSRLALLALVGCCALAGTNAAEWVDLFKKPWANVPLRLTLAIACPENSYCIEAGSHGDDAISCYKALTNESMKILTPTQMDGHSLMILSLAMHGKTGASAGVGALKDPGLLYTKDGGNSWHAGKDLHLVTGQDIEFIPSISGEEAYGFIGQPDSLTSETNGVIISKNGGENWQAHDWQKGIALPATCTARYGSFPSIDTWYVSAGTWPGKNSSSSPQMYSYNSRLHLDRVSKKFTLGPLPQKAAAPSGYQAAITKTTDGGKTWAVQHYSTAGYYFNDIHCITTEHCVAAAEGFSDGPSPGGRIFQTTDGGKTWVQKLLVNDEPDCSMMWVRFTSTDEVWVGGSVAKDQFQTNAVFYLSTDGGNTWTKKEKVPGVAALLSLDFITKDHGYASGITWDEVTTVMEYKA